MNHQYAGPGPGADAGRPPAGARIPGACRDHRSRSGAAARPLQGARVDRRLPTARTAVLQHAGIISCRARRPRTEAAGKAVPDRKNEAAKFFEVFRRTSRLSPPNFKAGACATCHSGPMLNQTNPFLPLPVPPGTRFQTVLVSELNDAGNPAIDFVFLQSERSLAGSSSYRVRTLAARSSPDARMNRIRRAPRPRSTT